MLPKPLAGSLALAAVLVTVSACSSGGGTTADQTPSTGHKTSTSSPGGGGPKQGNGKLKKVSGKGGVKNVFAKTSSGAKISLSAKAPGHEVMEQVYDASTKKWSEPTSLFKDDTRFCHSIKLKSKGSVVAATVSCSISAQDKNGTQESYVLASTDGKTWKRQDLAGASGKPSLSPTGHFVAWSSPTSFLLWNPSGTFTTVKYQQSSDEPAVGVMQNNGQLLIIKAEAQKHGYCVVSFSSASAKAPAVKPVNSTLPQADHPKCVATSAKMQGPKVIANFTQTDTSKVNGKKQVKTTTFAYGFGLVGGRWIIKE